MFHPIGPVLLLMWLPLDLMAQASAAKPLSRIQRGLTAKADTVVATLAGVPIRESEFRDYLMGIAPEERERVASDPQQWNVYLYGFLDQKVKLAKARKERIDQDPLYKKACHLTDMNLLIQALQNQDRPRLLKGLEVSDAELQTDYDARPDLFKVSPRFSARQVLVYVNTNPNFPGRGLDDLGAKEKARTALARLKAGDGWDAVAAMYSDDESTKAKGGLIKDASFSHYPPEIQTVLRTQPLGEIAGPLRSSVGYHLFLVEERVLEGQREPFEKVKPSILDRLTMEKRAARNKAYLDPIKAEVDLKVMPIATDPNASSLADADPLLATLGKDEIHDSDFQWFLRDAFPPSQRVDINAQPGVRQEMMQSYLNMRALEAKARKEGLHRTDDFLKARSTAEERLLVEFLMGRMNEAFRKEAMPTEDEQKAYYQQNPDRFRPIPWFSARQVLVSVKGPTSASDSATHDAMAKARAEEALNRLKAGESWKIIAEIFSDDPATKGAGGLIKRAAFSSLTPELEQAVRTQEMGKPMGPVRSALGYYVVQVEMRVTEMDIEPFEAVRAAIVKHLSPLKLEEAQKAYNARLRSEMGLVRNDPGPRVHPRVLQPRRQS